MKILVEIDDLTPAQALAIEDMMAMWTYLGGIGASRWTAFMADGDGNFRPKICVDGRKPEAYGNTTKRWKVPKSIHQQQSDIYFIDFDEIAWELREKQDDSPVPLKEDDTGV